MNAKIARIATSVTLAGALLFSQAVGAFAATPAFGTARLHPIGGSGISARVHVLDTGSELTFIGIARSLNPTKNYVSLIYDNGSVPSGKDACEPTNNSLSQAQMFVGPWMGGGSTRTLTVTKKGAAYTPLSTFRTMSVREDLGPSVTDPEKRFVLKACGIVHMSF